MTPTRLIQGENDIRCPMQQADELYAALVHAGCEAELLRLQACTHGLEIAGPPALRRYRVNAIVEWFDRHIQVPVEPERIGMPPCSRNTITEGNQGN